MRDDYVITIFSRRHGRTRTFRLKRRSISWALAAAGLLVFLVTLALGYGVLQLIQERRQLQAKVSRLEQGLHNQEERTQHQARKPTEEKPSPASEGSRADSQVAPPPQRESGQTVAAEAKSPETINVGIENPTAISLGGDDDWFRFEVKIKNMGGTPVLGAMAIVATCIPSVQPHFVSSPPMELGPDGLPANVRKSARFSIRNFRHMRGTFRLPFAQVESFRVLIYDASWHLVLDTIIPSAQVEARGVSSAQSS
jgi:hypothetical protein